MSFTTKLNLFEPKYKLPKSYHPNDETFDHFEPILYPLEDDGKFVKGFGLDKVPEIFRKYGIVVVENVLSNSEVDKTVNELWEEIRWYNPDIDKNNEETWSNDKWPAMYRYGIIGDGRRRALSQQACLNRVHPNVVNVYKEIFGTSELWTNVTRFGALRPTQKINTQVAPIVSIDSIQESETKDKEIKEEIKEEDYSDRSSKEFLHIDMNPITGRRTTFGFESTSYISCDIGGNVNEVGCNAMRFPCIQGFIALNDVSVEDGGFHAIPGSHKFMETWKTQNIELCRTSAGTGDGSTVWLTKNDPLYKYVQKFPVKKGSMLIWDNRIFHGNYPNKSKNFRMVQYIHAAPIYDMAIRPFPIPSYLHYKFETLTDHQKRMYGLLPYNSKKGKQRFAEKRNENESELFEIAMDFAKY